MTTSARVSPCPNCGGSDLYRSQRPVSAGGGYAPNYLPDLGAWYRVARFSIVVCRQCGLTRHFAEREALARLGDSSRWQRVT